ncbi:diadenylate cyclase CdaA [Melioribacter sp. Ez-97]|uniref:diadenylate cyclase CdaA n=1 Tax=Melioribacter sp. Ez-97 TaxID=3423434 RepID=UPI003ED9461A
MIELFKVGFITVTLVDIIDIALVSFIFYQLYSAIRGTIAAQIFYGLLIVLFLSFIAQAANFKALGWILKLISDIWVIAFIILFQPEIRRILVMLGRSPLLKIFIKTDESNVAEIIAESAFELAQHQHGALMVIVRTVGIKSVVETGEIINAKVSKNLIRSIFFPRSPLHDGAVVIHNDLIEAARCTLPLSNLTSLDGNPLGMRHRAGLGISEQADVICVIVSEETASISIADNGKLIRGISREELRNYLINNLRAGKERKITSIWKILRRKK